MSYRYFEGFKHICEEKIHFATNEVPPLKWCCFCWCGFDIMRDTCPCCDEKLFLPDLDDMYDSRQQIKGTTKICFEKCLLHSIPIHGEHLTNLDFHYCGNCRRTFTQRSSYCPCCDLYMLHYIIKSPQVSYAQTKIIKKSKGFCNLWGYWKR